MENKETEESLSDSKDLLKKIVEDIELSEDENQEEPNKKSSNSTENIQNKEKLTSDTGNPTEIISSETHNIDDDNFLKELLKSKDDTGKENVTKIAKSSESTEISIDSQGVSKTALVVEELIESNDVEKTPNDEGTKVIKNNEENLHTQSNNEIEETDKINDKLNVKNEKTDEIENKNEEIINKTNIKVENIEEMKNNNEKEEKNESKSKDTAKKDFNEEKDEKSVENNDEKIENSQQKDETSVDKNNPKPPSSENQIISPDEKNEVNKEKQTNNKNENIEVEEETIEKIQAQVNLIKNQIENKSDSCSSIKESVDTSGVFISITNNEEDNKNKFFKETDHIQNTLSTDIPQIVLDQLDLHKFPNLIINNEKTDSKSSINTKIKIDNKNNPKNKDAKLIAEIQRRIERRKLKRNREVVEEEEEENDDDEEEKSEEDNKKENKDKKTNKKNRGGSAKQNSSDDDQIKIKKETENPTNLEEKRITRSRPKVEESLSDASEHENKTHSNPKRKLEESDEGNKTLRNKNSNSEESENEVKESTSRSRRKQNFNPPKIKSSSEVKFTPKNKTNQISKKITSEKSIKKTPKPSETKMKDEPILMSRSSRKIKLTDKYKSFVKQEKNMMTSSDEDEDDEPVVTDTEKKKTIEVQKKQTKSPIIKINIKPKKTNDDTEHVEEEKPKEKYIPKSKRLQQLQENEKINEKKTLAPVKITSKPDKTIAAKVPSKKISMGNITTDPPKKKRPKKELISEDELEDDDSFELLYDEDKDPDYKHGSDSGEASDFSLASADSFYNSKRTIKKDPRSVLDLMSNIFKMMPTWNLHVLPNTNSLCLCQVTRGSNGIPMLKKSIEIDNEFNVKVFVHQIHYKKYDGMYKSENHFIQLLQLVDSM